MLSADLFRAIGTGFANPNRALSKVQNTTVFSFLFWGVIVDSIPSCVVFRQLKTSRQRWIKKQHVIWDKSVPMALSRRQPAEFPVLSSGLFRGV